MTRIPTLLAALIAGLVLAAGASAKAVKEPKLPSGWSHAEINVTIRGIPHTKIYDRGVVTAVAQRSLTLHEPDGSVVTIDVAPRTRVFLGGKRVRLARVRVGFTATTLRIDGGPAIEVRAVAPKIVRVPKPKAERQKPEKPEKAERAERAGGRSR